MANLKIGDKVLDFELPGVDGKNYSLKSFENKKVLAVIFSCNHCPYVIAWEDRMVAIQRNYADKGVALVLINANDDVKYPEDSFAKMVKRAKDKGYNFPYLRDESQKVARAFGGERTPEIFLFDELRMLKYHGPVDDNHDAPEKVKKHYLKDAIDAILSGKDVSVKEVPPVGCTIKLTTNCDS